HLVARVVARRIARRGDLESRGRLRARIRPRAMRVPALRRECSRRRYCASRRGDARQHGPAMDPVSVNAVIAAWCLAIATSCRREPAAVDRPIDAMVVRTTPADAAARSSLEAATDASCCP